MYVRWKSNERKFKNKKYKTCTYGKSSSPLSLSRCAVHFVLPIQKYTAQCVHGFDRLSTECAAGTHTVFFVGFGATVLYFDVSSLLLCTFSLSLRERSHNVCLFEKVHEYIRAVTACKRMCVYVIQWISFYILAIKIPGARIILALSERVCLCAWAQWEWEKRENFLYLNERKSSIYRNHRCMYICARIYVKWSFLSSSVFLIFQYFHVKFRWKQRVHCKENDNLAYIHFFCCFSFGLLLICMKIYNNNNKRFAGSMSNENFHTTIIGMNRRRAKERDCRFNANIIIIHVQTTSMSLYAWI